MRICHLGNDHPWTKTKDYVHDISAKLNPPNFRVFEDRVNRVFVHPGDMHKCVLVYTQEFQLTSRSPCHCSLRLCGSMLAAEIGKSSWRLKMSALVSKSAKS